MKIQDFKKLNIPDKPGVYFFLDKNHKSKSLPNIKNILYIGKATSLKSRVSSYFTNDLLKTRGLKLKSMIENAKDIFFVETNTVLEAIILESKYIKEFKPFFNTKEKDDKSYSYVVFLKEKYARVLIMRAREIEKNKDLKIYKKFGPFVSKSEIVEIMKILRKIFPYRDKCLPSDNKPCFNSQIGLCPGVCTNSISEKDYKKNLLSIEKVLNGNISKLVKNLEKEMKTFSNKKQFEEAGKIRDFLFSLNNIKDINLIKNDNTYLNNSKKPIILESYDTAHISGSNRVAVMCKFEIYGDELEYKKNEYKKFKLIQNINDDLGGLKEVLTRRLKHIEWTYPDFIIIDGGNTHLNFAANIVYQFENTENIKLISIVKDKKHKARDILFYKDVEKYIKKEDIYLNNKNLILANEEAHRFALSYHKLLRNKIKSPIK